ncbi:hypothetical protein CWATWH8502_3096 [Crocosphaera watsonii WH 8502]|uniref:Uncharacterized protein n=3 Tax=Crocosphaera watsonii TaxID=263511 RepID=T2JIG9_CROWT|nr:hypothetical protein CWATWH8502_3096 [Crocosphaera watsonii WH 8502]CCQ56306.1 hypothetical protein CWATWH0005_1932 [Crocosphaera watsonii WH 0005]CCQ65065.1 hypothetical protein CWATWH0402_2839 [Crocosphaera watsonii WH 0402]
MILKTKNKRSPCLVVGYDGLLNSRFNLNFSRLTHPTVFI